MKAIYFQLVLALLLAACSDSEKPATFEGTYQGVFYRVRDNVKGESSNVTLNFSNGHYTGTSSITKYPALCEGTFAPAEEQVNFTNTCMWTAEFDWTLILDGTFKITHTDTELILSKEIDPQNGDYYVLKKDVAR